jgi:hypothetical protein
MDAGTPVRVMDSAKDSTPLNMLPDEEVIYRTRAGRLSFSKYLPNSTVVATNKRLFVLGPLKLFSRPSTFSYDSMDSIDVKTGALSSKFIIKSAGAPKTIVFYNRGRVLAAFNIISNRILSAKDPNYADKKRAHALDTRYAVLNKGTVFEPPQKDKARVLAKIARSEPKQPRKGQHRLLT